MAKPKIERLEAYKKYKMELHEAMLQKQRVPYSIKRKMSEDRIRSFYKEAQARGYNLHVSVGGLDSIVLCYMIREMGYDENEIKFVSASTLEDASIQKVHKELGVICVRPLRNKVEVIQEFGFPILSKKRKTAAAITEATHHQRSFPLQTLTTRHNSRLTADHRLFLTHSGSVSSRLRLR